MEVQIITFYVDMTGVSCQVCSSPVLTAASLIAHLFIPHKGANGVNTPNTENIH
jgi:hypothetical protein